MVYYLKERGYDNDDIYYNSLSLPLLVSLKLANTGKESDVLFWNEDVGQELPGNMIYLLNNNTRTKKIIIQKKTREKERITEDSEGCTPGPQGLFSGFPAPNRPKTARERPCVPKRPMVH